MNARVSVIIPAHNAARFLAEAVASVRAQTYPAAELIVVDDGSTDDTAAVAAHLGGTIRVVTQNRSGAGAARNRGAGEATGEWLAFLDADDLWTPARLEGQFAWLAGTPATDVVFGQGCNFTDTAEGERREEPARPAFLPGAALLKRDYFLQAARFNAEPTANEAVEWYLRLLAAGARIGVVPELVLRRRVHGANSRRQGDGGRAADLRAVRAWISRRRSS